MIIIIVATILVFFLLFSIVFYPWTLMFFGFLFQPNPPKPEFTYGEFSCLLKYELNGETKIIEDTIICEFEGFKNLGTAGKKRKWKTRLKSGNQYMTLLNVESNDETNEFNQTIQELYFYYGNAEYYMGEEEFNGARGAQPLNHVSYRYTKPDGTVGHSSYNVDVAWEKYKIRLISWECEPAIANTYK